MLCGLSNRSIGKEPESLQGNQLHEKKDLTQRVSHNITSNTISPANCVQVHYSFRMFEHTMKLVGQQFSGNGATMEENEAKQNTVLDLVLPGIEGFLKDVLQQESLSDEGEKLRRFYVKILENSSGPTDTDTTETFGINKNDLSPLKTPPIKGSRFSYNGEGTSHDKVLDQRDYPKEGPSLKEPATNLSRQGRKGTDSTEESGVFLNTPFVSSGDPEVVNPRHSDTFESTSSTDTFLSNSDLELLEWENDSIVNEDGYCTEDNLDNTVQNMQIQPNEFGEIYSGILYIREQPGWHKRWFTITGRCMRCYKYRTDDKMLFEIPLRDGKFVSTDLKTSRMFPMTMSIARLKDNITFATTDEKTRQEWIYVINHVIKKLAEDPYPESPSPSPFDIKTAPFSSLLRRESVEEGGVESSSLEKFPQHSKTNIAEVQSEGLKRKTWHAVGEKGFEDVMKQWRVRGEDETADMELSVAPSLAQEESFIELQECLPDILQRPKSKSWRGDLGNIQLASSKKDLTGTKNQNRKTITFSADLENKQSSNSDLTNVPRVKRHGSLANTLTNKANRVRSKLTTSFFKKGKRDEKVYRQGSSQDLTFSGYLERKKGHAWKNRWCVVKNHTLFCYKEFGAPLAELELTLMGCGVKTLPEGEGDKSCIFVLSADKDQLYFAAENEAELEEWLAVLGHEARGADKEDDEINNSIDGAMLTTLSSPDSPQEPHKSFEPEPQPLMLEEDPKPATKRAHSFTTRTSKEKSEIQGPVKRSSLLGALANKLGRQSSRLKDVTDVKLDAVVKGELQPNEIENLVIPDSQPQTEAAQSLTENGPVMEGSLYYRPVDTWLKSKVKLQNHSLDIEPRDDFTDSIKPFESLKFRLVNCIVLDCTDTEGPLVMVVKRAIGQPLYLQADTEEDYNAWKDAISSAVLTTPSLIDRLMSSESGREGEESCKTATPNSSKISGDSFDRDDVFFVTGQENLVNPIPQPHPSPRLSIAGDVSSEGSVDDYLSKSRVQVKRAYSAGGIDRLRSLSEGYLVHSKKRQSPLRRTISNALTILDLSPTKRRRKTFGGLGVNASLLIGIKYTSYLYFCINKGLWTKLWCVLQQNNLHFFKTSEEISPISSMKLEGCAVVKKTFKGKKFAFVMKLPLDKTEYCFAAQCERELDIWVESLQAEGDVQRRSENPLATFDLLNGVLPRVKSEGNINNTSKPDVAAVDGTKGKTTNKNALRKMSKSLVELRKIREAGDTRQLFKDSNGNSVSSSSAITQKPTSLQEVLLLLQEQQLMQSMGHQRYVRVKKARGNWKKSAAAVLKDTNSLPESPEFPKKQPETKEKKEKIEAVPQGKPRGASTGSASSKDYADFLSSCQTSEDYRGKCEKLAEEEKLKALKTETLLRKRRNSLTLEKDVLQKKLEKTQEKKGTVKKLLGKDVVKNQEEIIRDQKRLKEIHLKLAHVDQDMRENKHKEAAVMENITALKSNPKPRRSSENYESVKSSLDTTTTTRSVYDERRGRSRESPTGSISSRDSFDDKNEPYRPSVPESAASLNRKGSKKTGQASLLALEEELQKISPNATRRKKYASGKRVSSSSEGSFDESGLKESPGLSRRYSTPPEEKRESIISIGSMDSHTKAYGRDNIELKKKRKGSLPTLSKTELHCVAVNIPTTSGTNDTDPSSASSEHRPSLITALSQIKDFEEFLEIHKLR